MAMYMNINMPAKTRMPISGFFSCQIRMRCPERCADPQTRQRIM